MASIKKQFVTTYGLDANSSNIINVLDPVNDQDALTKTLMEAKATKDSVRLATLTNIPYGGFSSGVITISNPTLTFTSVTSDTIPLTGHSFNTGDLIQLNPSVQDGSNFLAVGGTSQTTSNTSARYVIKIDANNIKIATSETNAFVGTSTTVTITGTVTVTVKVYPGIDGTTFALNDRVLVKNQTTTAQNGIYAVTNITVNAWVLTRASDFNSWVDVVGASTVVEQGSILSDTGWFCTSNSGGTLNTTAITFSCSKSNGLTLNPKYTTSPILDISNTWYSAATTFTGVKLNITDTASSSTSLLLDLRVGGTSKFNVDKNGYINNIAFSTGPATGSSNIGIKTTLPNTTTGSYNLSIGEDGLAANQTGSSNTGVGHQTLISNVSGNENTAVGTGALVTNTGSYNTVTGSNGFYAKTSGNGNTGVGANIGVSHTSGSYNTYVGYTDWNGGLGNGITTGSNNTIIGARLASFSSSLSNNIILSDGAGTIKLQHDGVIGWAVSDKVAIGGALSASVSLYVRGPIDGTAGTLYSTYNSVDITSANATSAIIYASATTVNASATSLTSITHFRAAGQTTMPVVPTNQYGFFAHSNISGATNNYGFYGNIAAASGRYNFYAAGTAENYFTGTVTSGAAILSDDPTAGVGYTTGAGGTVTQATSKSTGVTLNKVCGTITLHNASLAANTAVSFTLTNSAIAAEDNIILNFNAGTAGAYTAYATGFAAGSATITLRNVTAGALGEAVQIRFTVLKSVNS